MSAQNLNVMPEMNFEAPNHMKTMCYTSLYNLVEPGRTLPPVFNMAAVSHLGFSKMLFYCQYIFFDLFHIIYRHNVMLSSQHIEFHHHKDYSHFSTKSNMVAGSHLEIQLET